MITHDTFFQNHPLVLPYLSSTFGNSLALSFTFSEKHQNRQNRAGSLTHCSPCYFSHICWEKPGFHFPFLPFFPELNDWDAKSNYLKVIKYNLPTLANHVILFAYFTTTWTAKYFQTMSNIQAPPSLATSCSNRKQDWSAANIYWS